MEFEQLSLERIRIGLRKAISQADLVHLRDDFDLSTYVDHFCRSIVYELNTYIVGLPKERIEIHESWPADWWQAFRQRWFPAWWLDRWPVKLKTIDIDRTIYEKVCPHLMIDGHSAHVEFFSPFPRSLPPCGQGHYVRPDGSVPPSSPMRDR